jgi:hypothetical protein
VRGQGAGQLCGRLLMLICIPDAYLMPLGCYCPAYLASLLHAFPVWPAGTSPTWHCMAGRAWASTACCPSALARRGCCSPAAS